MDMYVPSRPKSPCRDSGGRVIPYREPPHEKRFQWPSETTLTLPSTTSIAVSSSIAYAEPPMSLAHFSASARVFSGKAG